MRKSYWTAIIDNNYQFPDDEYSLMDLTEALLGYLGSPDAELRETFAYEILARWIIQYQYHEAAQLRQLINWLMEQMNYEMGAYNDDTVFLRSYATLTLSLIMYRDSRENFLDEIEVQAILHLANGYLLDEQDNRAYVEDKGWANAIANVADLLRYIAHNSLLSPADMQTILHVIADKMMQSAYQIYAHDEEERLARVILTIMAQDVLTTEDLLDWVQRFSDWRDQTDLKSNYNAIANMTYQNIKRFLLSLYTRMQLSPQLPTSARDFEAHLLRVIGQFSL